ncbi:MULTISPECIES: type IV secretory system conjugative DNA transfer family protein [Cysteiniphilum]|nr:MULTISPECIES: type IV secretory system conjugative DNA transfer family protein [Cysteiniphilum]
MLVLTFVTIGISYAIDEKALYNEGLNYPLNTSSIDANEKGSIEAIQQNALRIGAQSGLYYQMNYLQENVLSYASQLDVVFNFQILMKWASYGTSISNLLPPVIQAIDKQVSIEHSGQKLVINNKVYKITTPAQIVGNPPNWRQYLLVVVNKPNFDVIKKPSTSLEWNAWDNSYRQGWVEGQKAANRFFNYKMAQLYSTFNGMMTYLIAERKGIVNKPDISSSYIPVSSYGSEMSVGNMIYTIDRNVNFEADLSKWKVKTLNDVDTVGDKHG